MDKDFNARTAIDLRATNEGDVDLFLVAILEMEEFANTLELNLYLRMTNAKPERQGRNRSDICEESKFFDG